VNRIPNFKITGKLTTATCAITRPFTGELIIEEADAIIKSVEVQLVRVETCGCADGFAKEGTRSPHTHSPHAQSPHTAHARPHTREAHVVSLVVSCGGAATEIQNIQIAEGDVCRQLVIPIFMIFPRLFTCPSTAARTFKIEFEVPYDHHAWTNERSMEAAIDAHHTISPTARARPHTHHATGELGGAVRGRPPGDRELPHPPHPHIARLARLSCFSFIYSPILVCDLNIEKYAVTE
jgi:hypothetical protein